MFLKTILLQLAPKPESDTEQFFHPSSGSSGQELFMTSLHFPRLQACMLSCLSHVRLFLTLWTVARQAPLSMRFSRQEYWSGLPCPLPGDLPDPGIKRVSLTSTCTGRQVLYHWHHLKRPINILSKCLIIKLTKDDS